MAKLAVFLLLGLTMLAHGQAVLTPPFGLKWGDSPESLIDWAGRHALDVRITLPGKESGLRIIRIEAENGALPASKAQAIEGRFQSGRLFEVAVHYGLAEETANAVEGRFNEMKRQLTAEYGQLSANQQTRTVEDDFATRTLSFHREPVRGLFLLLAFTEVEDLLRKSRQATFSLIYRNDNLRRQLTSPPRSDGKTGSK